jgi:putative flippase GtrA
MTPIRSRILLRFGIAGLVNTGFGYVVFALFVLMGAWSGVALLGSTVAGIAFNFQTSQRFVFRSHGQLISFVAVYIIVFALNWASLRALHWYGSPDLVSQALLVPPIAVISFLGQHWFVFGQASEPA